MWLLSLPVPLLFVITMAACLGSQLIKNSFNKRFITSFDKYVLISLGALITMVCLLLLDKISSISLYTVLMACGFGVLSFLQSFFIMKAFDNGSFAYTTVITSLSTIIPALSGAMFFGESISVVQIVGICFMMACFVLCVNTDKPQENQAKTQNNVTDKSRTIKWLIYVSITFLASGGIGIMQKIHQSSKYNGELSAFLIISFAVCMLASAIMAIKNIKTRFSTPKCDAHEQTQNTPVCNKRGTIFYVFIVLSGVFIALNNYINLYLTGVVPSAIFFPLVNGGNLVLVTLCALFIYKEKLTIKQWIGIAVGVISVILLGNPF